MQALEFDWRQAAMGLLERIPTTLWERQARAWLDAHCNEPWILACSGGADSLALLLLVWAAYPEAREQLHVVTYNHGARPEAEEETIFVRGVAASLGVKALTNHEVPVWPDTPRERQLRKVRLDFLRAVAATYASRTLLQGHQADDVIESFLLRAGRGSSLRALTAPRPVEHFGHHPSHVRPLLSVARDRLRACLQELNVSWQEDGSNADPRYRRNRVRQDVVPAWRQAVPHEPLMGVLAIREELEDAESVVETALDALPVDYAASTLSARAFSAQPALRRWALQRWLHRQGLAEHVNRNARAHLLEAWIKPAVNEVSYGGVTLRVGHGTIERLDAQPAPTAVQLPRVTLFPGATCFWPDGRVLQVCRTHVDEALWQRFRKNDVDVKREAWLRCSNLNYVQVRPWQPGDAYQPLGAPGRRKLQDLFTDRKIPEVERHQLPVILNEQLDVIWVAGVPPAHELRLRPEDDWALKLTYSPSLAEYNTFSHARESEQSTE
ncbi:MAG: tRNA(Ile)-lysidine synthase [Puniceicoccaceae bacterium 5H]|nr:MAG: tRNA(Ile)-lysidine synthase [Puniceicoccaceae bacterium 5H]